MIWDNSQKSTYNMEDGETQKNAYFYVSCRHQKIEQTKRLLHKEQSDYNNVQSVAII